MRIDATQTHAYMNLLAPLAWTAIASLKPSMAGKIPSLDSLGFKSDQATSATSNILLTQGVGKIAVNVSQPPQRRAVSESVKDHDHRRPARSSTGLFCRRSAYRHECL